MNHARTPLAAVVALGAALAMPLAFAQSAITPEVREAQKAAAGAEATPQGRQLGWNDVDADGNGTISREESAALPALAAVFDQADGDGDGELTPDEYRAHAANGEG